MVSLFKLTRLTIVRQVQLPDTRAYVTCFRFKGTHSTKGLWPHVLQTQQHSRTQQCKANSISVAPKLDANTEKTASKTVLTRRPLEAELHLPLPFFLPRDRKRLPPLDTCRKCLGLWESHCTSLRVALEEKKLGTRTREPLSH